MKKLLMGLAAIVATSFALPAFAGEEPKPAGGEGEKPAKAKKGKGKKAEEEKKPADAPAK